MVSKGCIQSQKYYLICCCLKSDIYYRCLHTLRDWCFVTTAAFHCCLDLEQNNNITKHRSIIQVKDHKYLKHTTEADSDLPERKCFWEQRVHENESFLELETVPSRNSHNIWRQEFRSTIHKLKLLAHMDALHVRLVYTPEVVGTWSSKHCTQHTVGYSQHTYTQ